MSDILERLCAHTSDTHCSNKLHAEAADEITRLRAENEKLREENALQEARLGHAANGIMVQAKGWATANAKVEKLQKALEAVTEYLDVEIGGAYAPPERELIRQARAILAETEAKETT